MKKLLRVSGTVLMLFWPLAGHATAEYYKLDKPHTQIVFSVNHLGFVESYGKFTNYKGGFSLDRTHPENSSVDVTIVTGSIDMGDDSWNDAVKAKGYFDVDRYPTMRFKSTKFQMTDDNDATVDGDLTLLGVTKPMTFKMHLNQMGQHPFMDRFVVGMSGEGTLERSDFGMTSGLPLVGDRVTIHLEVEGDRINTKGEGFYNQ